MSFILKGRPIEIMGKENKLIKFNGFEEFEDQNKAEETKILNTIHLQNIALDPEIFLSKLNALNTKCISCIHLENIFYSGTFENVYLPSLKEFYFHSKQCKDEDLNSPTVLFFYNDSLEDGDPDWDRTQVWKTNVDVSVKFNDQTFLEINHGHKSLSISMKSTYDIEEILKSVHYENVHKITFHFPGHEKFDTSLIQLFPNSLRKLDIDVEGLDWSLAQELLFRLNLEEFIYKPRHLYDNGQELVKIDKLPTSLKSLSLVKCEVQLAEEHKLSNVRLDTFALYETLCTTDVYKHLYFRKLIIMESIYNKKNHIKFEELDLLMSSANSRVEWIYCDHDCLPEISSSGGEITKQILRENKIKLKTGIIFGKRLGLVVGWNARELFLEEKEFLKSKYFGAVIGGVSRSAIHEHELAFDPGAFILKGCPYGQLPLFDGIKDSEITLDSIQHFWIANARIYNEKLVDLWPQLTSLRYVTVNGCTCSWPLGQTRQDEDKFVPSDPDFKPRVPAALHLANLHSSIEGITLTNTQLEIHKNEQLVNLKYLNLINEMNLDPECIEALSGMLSARQVMIQQPSISPSCLKHILGIQNLEQLLISKFSLEEDEKKTEMVEFMKEAELGGWEHNVLFQRKAMDGKWIGKYVSESQVKKLVKDATEFKGIETQDTPSKPIELIESLHKEIDNSGHDIIDFTLLNDYRKKGQAKDPEEMMMALKQNPKTKHHSSEKTENCLQNLVYNGKRSYQNREQEIVEKLEFDETLQIKKIQLNNIKLDPSIFSRIFKNLDPSTVTELSLWNVELLNSNRSVVFPNLKRLAYNCFRSPSSLENDLMNSMNFTGFLTMFLPSESEVKCIWNLGVNFDITVNKLNFRICHEERSLTVSNMQGEILSDLLESASHEIQSLSINSIINLKSFSNRDFSHLRNLIISSVQEDLDWSQVENFLNRCKNLTYFSMTGSSGTPLKEVYTLRATKLPSTIIYLKLSNVKISDSKPHKPLNIQLLVLQLVYYPEDFFSKFHLYFQPRRIVIIAPPPINHIRFRFEPKERKIFSTNYTIPNETLLETIVDHCPGTEWLYFTSFEGEDEGKTKEFLRECMHGEDSPHTPNGVMLEKISAWRMCQVGSEYINFFHNEYFPCTDDKSFNLVGDEVFENSLCYFNGFPKNTLNIALKSLHLERVRFSWEFLLSELSRVNTINLKHITLKWNSIFGEDLDHSKKILLPNIESFHFSGKWYTSRFYRRSEGITWNLARGKIFFVKNRKQLHNWSMIELWDAGVNVTVNNSVIHPREKKLVLDFEECNELLIHCQDLEYLSFRSNIGQKPFVLSPSLKYLELESALGWSELESRIVEFKFLEDLRFSAVQISNSSKKRLTIRKLPKSLKSLALRNAKITFKLEEIVKLTSLSFVDCSLENDVSQFFQVENFTGHLDHQSVHSKQIGYNLIRQPQLCRLILDMFTKSEETDDWEPTGETHLLDKLLYDLQWKPESGSFSFDSRNYFFIAVEKGENGRWEKLEKEKLPERTELVMQSFSRNYY